MELSFVNHSNNRHWTARLLCKGMTYGLDNCLTYEEDEPCIEFYDAQHLTDGNDPRGAEHLGQFVSRYFVSTLLEGEPRGIDLCGGVNEWYLDKLTLQYVLRQMTGPAFIAFKNATA